MFATLNALPFTLDMFGPTDFRGHCAYEACCGMIKERESLHRQARTS